MGFFVRRSEFKRLEKEFYKLREEFNRDKHPSKYKILDKVVIASEDHRYNGKIGVIISADLMYNWNCIELLYAYNIVLEDGVIVKYVREEDFKVIE